MRHSWISLQGNLFKISLLNNKFDGLPCALSEIMIEVNVWRQNYFSEPSIFWNKAKVRLRFQLAYWYEQTFIMHPKYFHVWRINVWLLLENFFLESFEVYFRIWNSNFIELFNIKIKFENIYAWIRGVCCNGYRGFRRLAHELEYPLKAS